MVKEAVATGATTEEAYEKACAMLGVDPADAEFEVLETEEMCIRDRYNSIVQNGKIYKVIFEKCPLKA